MSARRRALAGEAAGVLASFLVLAGCGGGGATKASSGAASGGQGQRLSLTADPGGRLRFDKTALEAATGTVTIAMSNPSQLTHSIAIEGNGVSVAGPVVTQGATSTVSASLKPGTYTFFCTVPGHRGAGMQGTLTVR